MNKKKNMITALMTMTLSAMLLICIFLCTSVNVQAGVNFDNVPDTAVRFTLTYPDGSEETFEDYEKAKEASGKEKLLGTYSTDKEGRITLKDYLTEGNVRLYESVVPYGYGADERNTVADLSLRQVKIVNRKLIPPTPDNNTDSNAGNNAGNNAVNNAGNNTVSINNTKPAGSSQHTASPHTGDKRGMTAAFVTGGIALAGLVTVFIIRRKKGTFLLVLISAGAIGVAGLSAVTFAEAAENISEQSKRSDFIINKADDNGDSVEGAVFEVYGSPAKVTWEEKTDPEEPFKNIVVLYSNDVHCSVDDHLGYAAMVKCKKDLEAEGNEVIMIDNGDAFQGGTMGAVTKGEAIVNIMNSMAYDIAIPGDHEFDYGMERFTYLTDKAAFPYISCNFTDLRTGKTVFEPYKIVEAGGRKLAFVGVTTPLTLTSSTPVYFQDEDGNYIYGFCGGEDGQELYDTVQKAVDDARAEGAEYCILMSHLGITGTDSPYMSTDVIENTTGIDAVLDGHSHSVVEMEKVKNAEGKEVLLSQAGYQLSYFGKLTIDPAGNLKTELIGEYERDESATAVIEEEKSKYNEILNETAGNTDYGLLYSDPDTNTRLVRNRETNLGDFTADAYRYVSGTEVAFINGGGLRTGIDKGPITYGDLLDVNPFGNTIAARYISGKELADALEYSVYALPDEFGGFLQVSGVTFDVDENVATPVKTDSNGFFVSVGEGARRVSNIMVNGEPMESDRLYKCASNSYIIRNGGNGYTMFTGDMITLNRNVIDADALKEYLTSLGGNVTEDYSDGYGQGRMNINSQ